MTAILICPADRSGMSLLAEKRPLALAPVLGRTLLDLALAHLAARGFIRVRVLAADRPEMVRASVGRGETWGLQVEVTPETRESSVVEASRKYPDVDPSHIQVLDHLPGHPNLRLFDDLTEGAHGSRARGVPPAPPPSLRWCSPRSWWCGPGFVIGGRRAPCCEHDRRYGRRFPPTNGRR
ncbi:MAG: Nucleotidyl transferase [Verrucomicrobiota bacterium]